MSTPKLLSPSQLALTAVAESPVGTPALHDHRCALCGTEIHKGELSTPYLPTDSFTDYPAMAVREGKHICGWCAGVLHEGRFTQQWANAIITANGVFRAGKNTEIAYWLLNPPDEPFIWVKLTQKKQHLVWRAPVNYGPGVIQVRFGEMVLSIRTDRLPAAVAAAKNLANVGFDAKRSTRKTPFMSSARDLDSIRQGMLHPTVKAAARDSPEHQAELSLLESLTPGELWALTALLYVPLDQLEKPEQVATTD